MSTQELSAIGYDNKTPKFNGNNYAWWKNRIQNVIMGIDYECWLVVKNGPNIILKTEADGKQVPKKDSELVTADYKLLEKNAKAMSILQQAIVFMATDTKSVLYLYPNDGSYSISIDKLTRASDYRSWRRSMEIALTSKKKIGFVLGTVLRSAYVEDLVKAEPWDTCNSMVGSEGAGSVTLTQQQFEQILKLMPSSSGVVKGSETGEDR
uniref:Retrotransposon Copia-like N-terminal domain-containing protein n=1 Tax=Chenopodium quinoa TaxID=63459 RepID=A0A803N5P7_CHEQI